MSLFSPLQRVAIKVSSVARVKAHSFLGQNLRKTLQYESTVTDDLRLTRGYGATPSQRALNNFVGIHHVDALENTVYAAINLAKTAKSQLHIDDKSQELCSHFVATNNGECRYCTGQVPQ